MPKKKIIIPESVTKHIEKEYAKSPGFRKAYIEEMLRLQLAYKIAQLRKSRRMSQARLAKVMGTSQQTISRLENPENTELTITTLSKIAIALDARLNIEILPKSA